MIHGLTKRRPSLLVAAFLVFGVVPPSAAAETKAGPARIHAEISYSEQLDPRPYWATGGFGADAGVAFGGAIALRFDFGVESYGAAPGDYTGQRTSGGGGLTVLSAGLGVRLSHPVGAVNLFGELAGGFVFVDGRAPSVVDETGALSSPGGGVNWQGAMGEWGLGVQTRRDGRFDYYLGIRKRGYGEVIEGSSDGAAFQIRLGILTR